MIEVVKKLRSGMFPEIKDWKDEQNHLRNARPKDLEFYHFLWFHPIAYTILKLGIPSIFLILSTIFAIKYSIYGLSPAVIVPVIGVIYCLVWLFRDINKIDIHLKTNLYDILMKD